jgi:AAA ATPase domain
MPVRRMIKLVERESEIAAVRAFARRRGILIVEGRAGVGKTAILDATEILAQREGRLVLRARGSDLESDFAFGVARQLFERHCAGTTRGERAALFEGVPDAARALVMRERSDLAKQDRSFAVVHGLYWLAVNLATLRPVLLAVDDAHWGDDASLRWLAYMAGRLGGIDVSIAVALRPGEPRSQARALLAVRAAATETVRPGLLSAQGVATLARWKLGNAADGDVCTGIHRATGGNSFYVLELLRALKRADHLDGARAIEAAVRGGGLDGLAAQIGARLRNINPRDNDF